jgi:hypothetical protein
MASMDDPGRYRLTLTLDGRPVMHGWWAAEAIAHGQIAVWVRTWGVQGSRITVTDTAGGTVIHSWPDEE